MDWLDKMELLDTSSNLCKILILNDNKYVVRYFRKIGKTTEYYRSTLESDIIRFLQDNLVNVAKIVFESNDYFIQQFVSGRLLFDVYKDHSSISKKVIDDIVNQIYSLSLLDAKELSNNLPWFDNKSFYDFQCNNTFKVFKNYYLNLSELYNELGISDKFFDLIKLNSNKINNSRNMCLIHGDRHKKNIILKDNGELVFIDWELGCFGDVAYDIAFHVHQMAYTKEDEEYFFLKLKEKFLDDFDALYSDVNYYRLFILMRSVIYHVYWTYLLYKENNDENKKKQLNHFMRRYNKLSEFKDFNLSFKSEMELDYIFSSFVK